MIIKRIRINNYKTYLDLDLNLAPSEDRPVILIGGMNGGGKTTLFEAICGALYGLKIKDKEHFRELLNNGAIGTGSFTQLAAGSPASAGFSEDTHYKAFVLYNGSTSSEILTVPTLGSRTLAAGQTALFFFNMTTGMMADGGIYNTTGTVTPTRFMFRSFSNSRNQIYIDNFTHDNTLTFDAIPEPSSAMLLLGSGSLLLFRRRKI